MLIPLCVACTKVTGDYNFYISKADSLYQLKDYSNSLEAFKSAFNLDKKNPLHLYNAANAAALAGHNTEAFDYLNAAIENGWVNIERLRDNPDLVILHAEQGWKSLVVKAEKKQEEYRARYAPIQAELLQILEDDQAPKQAFHATADPQKRDSIKQAGLKLDSLNVIKVKAILDKHGWLGADKVGPEANNAIFFVIQHAEIATQEKYLPMMREAVKRGDALANQLAYLEDRILLRQGKKQIYGSQIEKDSLTDRFIVSPIVDPVNVDNRRASVGLGPISDYLQNWDIYWNAEEHKQLHEKLK